MSVICLSSDDEDECYIVDNDDKDSGNRSLQTHQVFIVQCNQNSSYNEEADPSDGIRPDFVNNLGKQKKSYICNNNTASSNKSSEKQYHNELSLLENSTEITHHPVSRSYVPVMKNVNEHSTSDEIQNKIQLQEDFNNPSNQTLCVSTETKNSSADKERDNNMSQRDQIFNAVKLTSVSRLTSNSETDRPLNKCPTLPKLVRNKDQNAGSLKVLAEKLAQVVGSNNHSNLSLEQFNRSNQEASLSNLEKTILGVSKGYFKKDGQENRSLCSNTTTQTNKYRSKIKETRRKSNTMKFKTSKSIEVASGAEVSNIQMQLNINQLVQTVSETNTEVSHISLGTKNGFEKKYTQTPQTKLAIYLPEDSLRTGENIKVAKPSIFQRNINVVSRPRTKIKSNYELESTKQKNVVTNHKTKQKELNFQPKNEVVSKSKKKKTANQTKSNKPPSLKNVGPYDNKLKFTFDKKISSYSVSVVSPTELQPLVENHSVYQKSPQVNNVENSMEQNCSPCPKGVLIKETQVTKQVNDTTSLLTEDDSLELENSENYLQPETLGSGSCRSSSPISLSGHIEDNTMAELENNEFDPQTEMVASDDFRSSSIPLSNMINLKSSFVKHYNTVFDDKTDKLCIEMGFLLIQTIEELKKLQNLMETPHNNLSKETGTQQSHDFENFELNTAIQTCRDILHQSKRKFINNFSQIHDKINLGHIVGTQLKIVFLTAWFMKVFLSITSHFPHLMDIIQDVKTKSLDMLSDEIVKWPLICKAFIKDERQFESDCLLVLGFIKDCLEDQHESNFQSDIILNEVENTVEFQSVACTASNDLGDHSISTEGCTLNSKDSAIEVLQSNNKRKRHENKIGKSKQSPKKNKMLHNTDESQSHNEHETHENVRPTMGLPPSNGIADDEASRKITGNIAKQFNMDYIPSQSQPNRKQTQTQYLKEQVSNTNFLEPTNSPITFPSGQELEFQKNQLQVEAQHQLPPPLKQSYESNVFVCAQYENEYHSNYPVKSNSHGCQNTQYYQSYQQNLQNHVNSPSIYLQNQYHSLNQPYNQEISTNQSKVTPIGFQYVFPPSASASQPYNQQVPVRNKEGVEISSCPITIRTPAYPVCDIVSNAGVTINNYNITNFSPHITPDLNQ